MTISRIAWQLPQTVIGFIFLLYLKVSKRLIKKQEYGNSRQAYIFTHPFISGASFGEYIFLQETHTKQDYMHEWGHSAQSMLFGPMYLIVIGIPSVLNNLRARKNPVISKTYYHRFPEKWADELGGVQRGGGVY